MTGFVTLLSPLSTIAVIFMFFILARLSEKLGAVTRMPPYYRWFWIGMGFLGIALIAQLVRISVSLTEQASHWLLSNSFFYLVTYHLPMALGVTIGLVIAWRYWGWLLTERDG